MASFNGTKADVAISACGRERHQLSMVIWKNLLSPLSGGFNEAQVGLVISAFGRTRTNRVFLAGNFVVHALPAGCKRSS